MVIIYIENAFKDGFNKLYTIVIGVEVPLEILDIFNLV